MSSHARIWGLPFIELVLPGLVTFALFAFGQPVSFPLSQTSTALQIFPKLASEQAVIGQIYSAHTASNYTLTYANSFLLGALFLVGGVLFEAVFRSLTSLDSSNIKEGNSGEKIKEETRQSLKVKNLVAVGLLLLTLMYFSFYLPIAFVPTSGVSETRLINSVYGAFIFAFPVLFTLVYFLSLAGLNLIMPLATTIKE